ncbi:MAG TPA: hypothetical protein VMV37_16040 [Gammaproteobacteria bacterium]|nr:hypothetical protein [Gammaproteobacteria bacterium]
MRGGAIPLLAWGTLLAAMLAINWIWTGDALQVGEFGFAVLVIYGGALLLWLASRDSITRGPPRPRGEPETLPQVSLAPVLIALSVAAILFGLVWANFLVYVGAGTLALSLGRLGIELRAERDTRRRIERDVLR